MDLERSTVVLRPRRSWEAMDLGIALLRAHYGAVLRAWIVCVLPLAALPFLVLGVHSPWAFLVVWWCKPLFDRAPLHVLSRAVFGHVPGPLATLRATWWRPSRTLLMHLLLARPSPFRCLHLPAAELEGLRGGALGKRLRALGSAGGGSAAALTITCVHLEVLLILAWPALVLLFDPRGIEQAFAALQQQDGWFGRNDAWLSAVVFVMVISIVEPLYVAAGFGVYLSARTELEGWDVELHFRRLQRRLAGLARTAGAVLLLALLAGTAGAQDQRPPPPEPEAAIAEVLASPDFVTERKELRPRRAHRSGGGSIGGELAMGLEVVVWIVVAAGVALLLWTALLPRTRPAPAAGSREGASAPATLFGLDLRADTLPADVAGEAWQRHERGDPAAALSLLYRAALAHLVRDRKLALTVSATEGDCVSAVATLGDEAVAAHFTRLTHAWQSCAYARRPPASEAVRALCEAHRLLFQGGRP